MTRLASPFSITAFPSSITALRMLVALGATLALTCSRRPKDPETREEASSSLSPQSTSDANSGQTANPGAPPATPAAANNTDKGPASADVRWLDGPGILEAIRSSGAKFTLLNFWASWCGPCRQEFPMLMGLSANLETRGLKILFVSLDEPESIPAALEFAANNGLHPPIAVAERPIGALKAAIHPGWPGMLPASFLFDQNGILKYFWGGPVFEHELLPILDKALSGEDISGEMHFGLAPGKDMRHE